MVVTIIANPECLAHKALSFAGCLLILTAMLACDRRADTHTTDTAEPVISHHTPSDPLVLRGQDGITLRGLAITSDPAIELHGCKNITIIDCDLTRVIVGGSSNVRIVNNFVHDSNEEAIYLDDCDEILVQGNRIERVKTGVLAHQSAGIKVIGNYCRDVLGPLPGGQLVQFDKVSGAGNAITHNYAVNYLGSSNPEDMISLYQSHGSRESPILIENNYLAGDPQWGSQGKSESGSGIMLGDNGGSWQICRNNTLLSPGQVGIGVAGGEYIYVQNNFILGKQSDVSNVGIYVWNQYKDKPAGQIGLDQNTVGWTNREGKDNPYWEGGGFPVITNTGFNFGGYEAIRRTGVPSPPSEAPQPPVPFVESEE